MSIYDKLIGTFQTDQERRLSKITIGEKAEELKFQLLEPYFAHLRDEITANISKASYGDCPRLSELALRRKLIDEIESDIDFLIDTANDLRTNLRGQKDE